MQVIIMSKEEQATTLMDQYTDLLRLEIVEDKEKEIKISFA